MLLDLFLLSSKMDGQIHQQIIAPKFDSLIKEVKVLTKYESGLPTVFGKLENYCWDLQTQYWDSILGGKTIRYPDSLSSKKYLCASISLNEKTVFNKLVDIKKLSTDDILVELAKRNSSEISIYCFLLLCSDDNPKCKKILDYYLSSNSEIWIEQCGHREKQKIRDFMLDRLFTCLLYDGRITMTTEKELANYLKIAKDYKSPWTITTE